MNRLTMDSEDVETSPWIRGMQVVEPPPHECQVGVKGPTYKVDLVVGGIRTRGLLDYGVQVSLAWKELLPLIKEKRDWLLEQCNAQHLRMEAQPVGSSGKPIGMTALVLLEVTVEDSGMTQQVPCYVLDSSKPIWQGEVNNCSLVLGTNALLSLGFMVSHCDSTVIELTDSTTTKGSCIPDFTTERLTTGAIPDTNSTR